MCHDRELNLKEVARELGVHYMTAYRYVRAGRLTAHRDGTSWLVRADELARFRGEDLAPHDHAVERPLAPVDWVGRLRNRLVVGDEAGAWVTVEAALVAGWGPEAVLVDLIGPAVATASLEDGLAAGHLATTTAQRTMAVLGARFRRRGRSRGTVVLGAPAGEGHAFALAMIADVLRLRNVSALELGVDVSAAAFADAATRAERLVAVAIGVTGVDHLGSASAVIDAVRDVVPDVPVLVGGRAVANPEIASLAGATGWAANAPGLADLVETLVPMSRAVAQVR